MQTAKALEAEHRAAINAAAKQLDILGAQHSAALAEVLHAEAMQQRAHLSLSYTTLVAPFLREDWTIHVMPFGSLRARDGSWDRWLSTRRM